MIALAYSSNQLVKIVQKLYRRLRSVVIKNYLARRGFNDVVLERAGAFSGVIEHVTVVVFVYNSADALERLLKYLYGKINVIVFIDSKSNTSTLVDLCVHLSQPYYIIENTATFYAEPMFEEAFKFLEPNRWHYRLDVDEIPSDNLLKSLANLKPKDNTIRPTPRLWVVQESSQISIISPREIGFDLQFRLFKPNLQPSAQIHTSGFVIPYKQLRYCPLRGVIFHLEKMDTASVPAGKYRYYQSKGALSDIYSKNRERKTIPLQEATQSFLSRYLDLCDHK